MLRTFIQVLIFCVEFRELSHLTHSLSQAEMKITVATSWATDKMTMISTEANLMLRLRSVLELKKGEMMARFSHLVTIVYFHETVENKWTMVM